MSKQRFSEIKKLHQKKFRDESEKFIIEGWKTIEEAVKSGMTLETIVYDEEKILDNKLFQVIKKSAKEMLTATTKEIDALSDTVTSQGIIAVLPKLSSLHHLANLIHNKSAMIVAVDQINDPGNLGTIIRTCDWFGVDAMVVSKNSVDVYNPKVVRATMGSLFHFPVVDNTDLVSFLKKSKHEGYSVYTTALSGSKDLRTAYWEKKSILVIGNESHGVSKEVSFFADTRLKIPSFGKAESLNAAMACGIILSYLKLK